jgi:hypothetical protein
MADVAFHSSLLLHVLNCLSSLKHIYNFGSGVRIWRSMLGKCQRTHKLLGPFSVSWKHSWIIIRLFRLLEVQSLATTFQDFFSYILATAPVGHLQAEYTINCWKLLHLQRIRCSVCFVMDGTSNNLDNTRNRMQTPK